MQSDEKSKSAKARGRKPPGGAKAKRKPAGDPPAAKPDPWGLGSLLDDKTSVEERISSLLKATGRHLPGAAASRPASVRRPEPPLVGAERDDDATDLADWPTRDPLEDRIFRRIGTTLNKAPAAAGGRAGLVSELLGEEPVLYALTLKEAAALYFHGKLELDRFVDPNLAEKDRCTVSELFHLGRGAPAAEEIAPGVKAGELFKVFKEVVKTPPPKLAEPVTVLGKEPAPRRPKSSRSSYDPLDFD